MSAKTMRRIASWALFSFALLTSGPLLVLLFGPVTLDADWRTASQRSTDLAPDPERNLDAVVQIYASRAFSWRGAFAVHTWLAAKPIGAHRYTRYEVIGWNLDSGDSAVSVSDLYAPDAEWFGAAPKVIYTLRGAEAEAVVKRLPQVTASYPYANNYRAWPGPNSNTFIAYLGREIPELRVVMPPNAIGKDYLLNGRFFAPTPSRTGYQLSLSGVLGLLVAGSEGIEFNILGLVTGVELQHLALKLPGIGRIPAYD